MEQKREEGRGNKDFKKDGDGGQAGSMGGCLKKGGVWNPPYELCMDTCSFIVHVKTDDIYEDIVEDVETRFDTSDFEIDTLPKGKNKKVIGVMKVELGGKIMKDFVGLRAKTYSYLKKTMVKTKK